MSELRGGIEVIQKLSSVQLQSSSPVSSELKFRARQRQSSGNRKAMQCIEALNIGSIVEALFIESIQVRSVLVAP